MLFVMFSFIFSNFDVGIIMLFIAVAKKRMTSILIVWYK